MYLNLWSKHPAEPFDLAAGALIVRRAGGEVIDLEGKPIDSMNHAGAFVAGSDRESLARLIDLVRASTRG